MDLFVIKQLQFLSRACCLKQTWAVLQGESAYRELRPRGVMVQQVFRKPVIFGSKKSLRFSNPVLFQIRRAHLRFAFHGFESYLPQKSKSWLAVLVRACTMSRKEPFFHYLKDPSQLLTMLSPGRVFGKSTPTSFSQRPFLLEMAWKREKRRIQLPVLIKIFRQAVGFVVPPNFKSPIN